MAKQSILFVGAHPDDTECFAGTAFLLRDRYDIHVVDLTRGENGLGPAGREDGSTGRIRTAEEMRACASLGATPHFLHDVNGAAVATRASVDELVRLFAELKPVAVFTHWPVDTHPDHVQCAAVVGHAFRISGHRAERYFFEASIGQTANWRPLYSVDISAAMAQKLEMLARYACQNPDDSLVGENERRAARRGGERKPAVRYAETFDTFDGEPIVGGILEGLSEAAKIR